ncbi:MAG: tRNA preQ1(34) S-adenosylmethionine ribosyltransferase-isomerase QueA [Bacteroidetes bacterium]|nr:MAG: tRNA preQ1(34) S-adenosylmethionine ribosyltransferase-isomerase QueA [Bacteroidota bacterium]
MLEEFDYHLPKERIAQQPTLPRDKCKFLVLNCDKIEHRIFHEIVDYLHEGDALVLNDSKVIKARIFGRKETGGKIELLLLGKKDGYYECLVGGKVREGTKFYAGKYEGKIISKHDGRCLVELPITIEEWEKLGKMPTPPYIKKEIENDDWYQTVYARKKGSIAAPTAGLHFTSSLLKKIKNMGVEIVYITLHVGLATFLPVKSLQQKMEKEYFYISEEAAMKINEAARVIAVGTTVVRALESASENGITRAKHGYTDIFIRPGYKFKSSIKGLITNFHMPKSSPLLLVSAFAGREKIMKAYEEALNRDYRFLSFGDAMLILKCSN